MIEGAVTVNGNIEAKNALTMYLDFTIVQGNVSAEHTAGTRPDPATGIPDSTEIVTNIITGNLGCEHNSPPARVGDSEGATNIVLGKKSGECAGL